MNWEQVMQRIEAIIHVDVMSDTDYDFMATHTPMDNLELQQSGFSKARTSIVSENEVYEDLVRNPRNEHRLVLISGGPGVGKSHLIRWLHARAMADSMIEQSKEKLVFIRRAENNLKGTIKQLLDQGVVVDSVLQERLTRFTQGNAQDKDSMLSTIYYAFLTAVENGTDDSFSTIQKRRLVAFLSDSNVKNHLSAQGGPIRRFYRHIVEPHGVSDNELTQFVPEDFKNLESLMRNVRDGGGSTDAQMYLKTLDGRVDEAEKLSKLLNGYATWVVRRLVNMVPGDLDGMIQDLRRELYRQGQSLTLFIEDLTTFTGIDTELIKLLSIEHGGAYQEFCRVSSFIGITDAYYDRFYDNQRDRVTHRIHVGGAVFTNEFAQSMTVRYINTAYLSSDDVKKWYDDYEADPSLIPYKSYNPPFQWDSVDVGDRQFTLFPLNRHAISYVLGQDVKMRIQDNWPTPRSFLRDFLKAQVRALCEQQLGLGTFPDTSDASIGTIRPSFANPEHNVLFDRQPIDNHLREALRALLCVWGNADLYDEQIGDMTKKGGLPTNLFDFLGLPLIDGVSLGQSGGSLVVPNPYQAQVAVSTKGTEIPSDPVVVQKNSQVSLNRNQVLSQLESWYKDGASLIPHEELRDALKEFLEFSLPWQMEGVPHLLIHEKLLKKYLHIEGQTGGFAGDPVFLMKRDEHSYAALKALTYWRYNERNWGFQSAQYFQYRLLLWLERNRDALIRAMRGEPAVTPYQLLKWRLSVLFVIHCATGTELPDTSSQDRFINALFRPIDIRKGREPYHQGVNHLHEIVQNTKGVDRFDNKTLRLLNTQLGTASDSGGDTWLIYRDVLMDAIEELNQKSWDPTDVFGENVEDMTFIKTEVQEINQMVTRIKGEMENQRVILLGILENFRRHVGRIETAEGWLTTTTQIKEFSSNLSKLYVPHEIDKQYASGLIGQSNQLAALCDQALKLGLGHFVEDLRFWASRPLGTLGRIARFFGEVETVATNLRNQAIRDTDVIYRGMGTNMELNRRLLRRIESLKHQLSNMMEA